MGGTDRGANHWLLYAIMILMPLTGYVLATAAARPSPYFWLFYWPQPAVSRVVAHAALRAHLVGQYSSTRWLASMWRPLPGTSSSDEMGLLSECFPPKTGREPDRRFARDLRPLPQRSIFREARPLSVLEIVEVAASHELEFVRADISTEMVRFPVLRR